MNDSVWNSIPLIGKSFLDFLIVKENAATRNRLTAIVIWSDISWLEKDWVQVQGRCRLSEEDFVHLFKKVALMWLIC